MNIAGERTLVAETQAVIAESRRVLDQFYGGCRDWPVHRPDPMICLLCDCQAPVMNRAAFRISDDSTLSDGHLKALSFRFQTRFGVCDSCLRLYYEGERGRVLFVLNRS